ncbi:hypothetical protein L3Y34_009873 [Caenorhabditis briggsae]|uniref:Uncharacterized protein n=1 Tax=Caenorhabditis briggsae TaxID=6238 RepID=A0AAE9D3H6_CAEBR|nr:hypothetical protein L3Y34_009873 [Caenorhabditis briggsae]
MHNEMSNYLNHQERSECMKCLISVPGIDKAISNIMHYPNPSSWYWIIDLITSILCGYSNFLFLPIHALRAHAITREFEIFNEELENADKEKKLEMLATSHVLLNSTILQETNDPLIFENYRMILERSLHNRLTNNVLHVFSITRKNLERLFFVHSVMIIIMVWTFELDDGIAKGFEGIGKMIMMMNMTGSHDNV